MSLPDHEKRLPELVGTVASRFLAAMVADHVAAFNMDMFARLSILEGAAGVPAGKWLRSGERGFGAALEHFGPHLAASWTTMQSQGVYDKALAVATRMLSSASGLDPADLIQDMTLNSSRPSGPDRTKLFYAVGKKLASHKNDLGAGSITPRDSKIMGSIDRWVRKAALDELKSWKSRNITLFAPGQDGESGGTGRDPNKWDPTRTRGTPQLDHEMRDKLILLALQSPGGPGNEVRRTIDRLIDQSFPKRDRGMVRLFLQKISEPKYRSAEQMRQIVKRFTPEKWFSQALGVIRNEIMQEMGVSAQQLTNALGGKASKVLRFMSEKVGKDSRIKKIIEDLGEEIEVLEPGVYRVAKERRYELTPEQTPQQPHKKMLEWLEDDDNDDTPHDDHLHDIFEKDEYMDWDASTGPHAVYNRGPMELRVARRFLLGSDIPQELRTQRFRNPDTGHNVLFQSLPPPEQQRILMRYRQREGEDVEVPARQKEPGLLEKMKRRLVGPDKAKVKKLESDSHSAIRETGYEMETAQTALGHISGSGGKPERLQKPLNKLVDEAVKLEKIKEDPGFRKLPSKQRKKIEDTLDKAHGLIDEMTSYSAGSSEGGGASSLAWEPLPEGKKPTKEDFKERWPMVQEALGAYSDPEKLEGLLGIKLPRVDGRPRVPGIKEDGRPDNDTDDVEIRKQMKRVTPSRQTSAKGLQQKRQMLETLQEEAKALLGIGRKGLLKKIDEKTSDAVQGQLFMLRNLDYVLETAEKAAKARGTPEQVADRERLLQQEDEKKERERSEGAGRADALMRQVKEDDLAMSDADYRDKIKNWGPGAKQDALLRRKEEQEKRKKEKLEVELTRERIERARKEREEQEKRNKRATVLRTSDENLTDPHFLQWAGKKKWRDPKSKKEVAYLALPQEERLRVYKKWERDKEPEGKEPEGKKPEGKEPEGKEPEGKKPEGKKPEGTQTVEEFLSVDPDQRLEDEVEDDHGNTFSGSVKVNGNPIIRGSKIKDKAQVNGRAQVKNSTISGGAVVEDQAKVSRSEISDYARLRGTTEITNAKIKGGSWDGQKIPDGRGGTFHDAYPQEILDLLLGVATTEPGPGDGPLRAMARYFADGGRTKGWFGVGGKLDRKKLTQHIQDHVYDQHDRKTPWLGRGVSFIDDFDDEGFEKVMGAAKELGGRWKADSQKKGSGRRMLYELTKMAFVYPELRADLMPFVKLGHEARIASHSVDLRGIAIRAAYNSRNHALRSALLEAVVAADGRSFAKTAKTRKPKYRQPFLKWIANRKFPNPNPEGRESQISFYSLSSQEQSKIYQEWQANYRDWARQHMPAGLGSGTRVTNENFDDIKIGDVLWYNASPGKPLKVTGINREGWRANNPTLELIQVDLSDPGFQGQERSFTKSTLGNENLELHRLPDQGPAGEERRQKEKDEQSRKKKERVRAKLPREPKGGWPDFDHLGLGAPAQRSVQQAFKGMVDARDPGEMSLSKIKKRLKDRMDAEPDRKVLREFMHQLGAWAAELGQAAKEGGEEFAPQQQMYRAIKMKVDSGIAALDGEQRDDEGVQRRERTSMKPDWGILPEKMRERWDDEQQDKMKPVYAEAMKEIAEGRFVDAPYVEKLIEKLNRAGAAAAGMGRPVAVGVLIRFMNNAAENASDPKKREKLEEGVRNAAREAARMSREHQQKNVERALHKDRKELRGGGQKKHEDPAQLSSWFISQVLPKGVSETVRAKGREQLKKATYANLGKMVDAADWLLSNWDDDRAKKHPLVQHLGYDREGLKKLKKLIKRKMGDVRGRQYHAEVLEVANKYGLEPEDADALYDWRADKPGRGARISDQEKMSRFLAKAKPETRERMKGMGLADFMVMYKAILKEVLEEEELASQAA